MRQRIEGSPKSGRERFLPPLSLSRLWGRGFLGPGAAPLPVPYLPGPSGRPAHSAEHTGEPIRLPEMSGVLFQPEQGNSQKGQIPSD